MGNMRIIELDQSNSDQIQSDPPSSAEVEYQATVFTIPPNRDRLTEQRQISAVSSDSDSIDGEE